jgi:hypothetical protein
MRTRSFGDGALLDDRLLLIEIASCSSSEMGGPSVSCSFASHGLALDSDLLAPDGYGLLHLLSHDVLAQSSTPTLSPASCSVPTGSGGFCSAARSRRRVQG